MRFNDYIFAFDFDGTLVKLTHFENHEKNIQNFKEFKLFINPDAFELNWCIVTSRPKSDLGLLQECLHRNLATNYVGLYTQPYDVPVTRCDEEYRIKAHHLKNLNNNSRCRDKRVVYVDNSERVRLMIKKTMNELYPNNDVLFKDTVTLFKYFVQGEFKK